MKSPPLSAWFQEQRDVIQQNKDSIHLITGEEGDWKSLWMRKCAAVLDPQFGVRHIHFNQEDFMDDVATLEPGRAVVLDEFDGHRRLAMHGSRMRFLRWAKNNRELSLHVFIGFPQVSQFERDLLNMRIRWWEHKPNRPKVVIRRRKSGLRFELDGTPINRTKFPKYGNYTMTGDNDPHRSAYQAKKKQHMIETALDRGETESKLEAFPADDSAVNEVRRIMGGFGS